MATGSGAFNAKCGFNQSGGGYYIATSQIYANTLAYTAGTGSGGATTVGTFAAYNTVDASSTLSTVTRAGTLVKDLGKTVVSSGRTFRKFQTVLPTALNSSPTFGVGGTLAGNYYSFYLEIGRDGAATGSAAPIARYA